MGSWSDNPIAVYTGTWSITNSLPAAALDPQGNLLIVWADNSQQLNLYYTQPSSANFSPVKVAVQGGAQGSPSVVFANDSFYVFWRAVSGQLYYGTVQSSNLSVISNQSMLVGANSNDGPQVAVDQNTQAIWVAWRGLGSDESLYFSPLVGTNWSTSFVQGGPTLNSLYSPAAGFIPSAPGKSTTYLCTVYRGADIDTSLWDSYYQIDYPAGFQPNEQVTTAGNVSLQTDQRPSLAIFPTESATGSATGTVLIVYTWNQTLSYTTSSFNTGFTSWASPGLVMPTSFMNNPLGVLVAADQQSSSVYLLVADGTTGTINNVLYLYQYTQ